MLQDQFLAVDAETLMTIDVVMSLIEIFSDDGRKAYGRLCAEWNARLELISR